MPAIVLVNGLIPHDAGKTWFTLSLAKSLMDRGLNISVYKPVAGHSAWYQFQTVLNSLKYGILVGEDVVKYIEVLGLNLDFELINPLDILLAPPDPRIYKNMVEYLGALEDQFKQVVLFRISNYKGKVNDHYIVVDNVDNVVFGLKKWINELAEKLKAKSISLSELIKLMYSKKTLEVLDYNLDLMLNKHDVVIVESFNDAAIPYYNLLEKVDVVFTVAPGYVYVINAMSFKSTVKEYYLKYGDLGLKMSNIMGKVKVISFKHLVPARSPLEQSIDLDLVDTITSLL